MPACAPGTTAHIHACSAPCLQKSSSPTLRFLPATVRVLHRPCIQAFVFLGGFTCPAFPLQGPTPSPYYYHCHTCTTPTFFCSRSLPSDMPLFYLLLMPTVLPSVPLRHLPFHASSFYLPSSATTLFLASHFLLYCLCLLPSCVTSTWFPFRLSLYLCLLFFGSLPFLPHVPCFATCTWILQLQAAVFFLPVACCHCLPVLPPYPACLLPPAFHAYYACSAPASFCISARRTLPPWAELPHAGFAACNACLALVRAIAKRVYRCRICLGPGACILLHSFTCILMRRGVPLPSGAALLADFPPAALTTTPCTPAFSASPRFFMFVRGCWTFCCFIHIIAWDARCATDDAWTRGVRSYA